MRLNILTKYDEADEEVWPRSMTKKLTMKYDEADGTEDTDEIDTID